MYRRSGNCSYTFLRSRELLFFFLLCETFEYRVILAKKPASFVLCKTFFFWTKITYCCDTLKMIERGNKRMTNDHKLVFSITIISVFDAPI